MLPLSTFSGHWTQPLDTATPQFRWHRGQLFPCHRPLESAGRRISSALLDRFPTGTEPSSPPLVHTTWEKIVNIINIQKIIQIWVVNIQKIWVEIWVVTSRVNQGLASAWSGAKQPWALRALVGTISPSTTTSGSSGAMEMPSKPSQTDQEN